MKTTELTTLLAACGDKPVSFVLPDGGHIPPHAHITEVGRIDREFLDCGGVLRRTSFCSLQAWVADDTDHRLSASKLVTIISRAFEPLGLAALPVEVEFEDGRISQFPVVSVSAGEAVVLHLGTKHTDCLAKEICLPAPGATEGCCAAESGNC